VTKRQREVAQMLHEGWQLEAEVSRVRTRKNKAYLYRQQEGFLPVRKEISFSIVDVLQSAHIIRPVTSAKNQRVWIYELVDPHQSRMEQRREREQTQSGDDQAG
jgi:hypothetical protein